MSVKLRKHRGEVKCKICGEIDPLKFYIGTCISKCKQCTLQEQKEKRKKLKTMVEECESVRSGFSVPTDQLLGDESPQMIDYDLEISNLSTKIDGIKSELTHLIEVITETQSDQRQINATIQAKINQMEIDGTETARNFQLKISSIESKFDNKLNILESKMKSLTEENKILKIGIDKANSNISSLTKWSNEWNKAIDTILRKQHEINKELGF